jgi:membrane protease YdiL (CAAX protease family)
VTVALLGLFGYPIVVLVLVLTTPLALVDALFLAVLLELLPALAIAQSDGGEDLVIERTQAYLTSGASIMVLGSLSLGLGLQTLGSERLGLHVHVRGVAYELLWTVALVAVGIMTFGAFVLIRRKTGSVENQIVRDLMPVTSREKGLFAGLSLCAGLGEELTYRGYALSVLMMATGSMFFALASTSLAFGVLHSYQGKLGVVRTGVVGFFMGAAFIHTGSLWPPIVAHALIDLVAGLVLRDRLLA